MMIPKKRHSLQLILIICSVWCIYTFAISGIPLIENVTLKGFDTYTSLSNTFKPSSKEIEKITIINIDNETQRLMNLRLPWKRTFFVPIIEKMNEYKPKVIYLDFMFYGETPYDETTDIVFAKGVKEAGNVVIPYVIDSEGKANLPYKFLIKSTAGIGYSNKIRDLDGIIRSYKPMVKKYNSVEIAILNHYRKTPFTLNAPLRENGSIYINYQAYSKEFRTYTLIDLFNNKIPEEALSHKIVLLGSTADITPDLFDTPLGPTYGIYLTVNTLLMHLSGSYIREINPICNHIIMLILGFLAGLVTFRFPAFRSLLIISLITICIFVSCFLLFNNGLFINFLNILLFLTLIYVTIGFFRYISLLKENVIALKKANIEIQNAQNELIRQEQLATIGRLTSQILHEFSNPMDNLKSSLSMLKNEIEQEHKLKKIIDISHNEIVRMSNISRQLKSSYTPHAENLIPSSINEILKEVLDTTRYRLQEKKITLSVKMDESLEKINVSADKIKQVFLNIIINAVDALKENGKINVSTYKNDKFQYITFEDNGCGIPSGDIPKLFTAFYTTKPSGKGSGLGLFISYEIIKAHKGEITVESKAGAGTKFTIKLPIT